LRTLEEVVRWLKTEPTLAELKDTFPNEWKASRAEMLAASQAGTLRPLIEKLSSDSKSSADHREPERERIAKVVRAQMILRTLRSVNLSTETGTDEGPVRLRRSNGWIMQGLFFGGGLVRKPASYRLYRLLWPRLRDRRKLLALVRSEGIYCFYSSLFIRRLAAIVGDQTVLEIAAGDGTLTRFLRDRGVACVATDDYSWSGAISYPSFVERQDARLALSERKPEVVVCSWPPPNNPFEAHVFTTDSVRKYVVILGSARGEAGNWEAYARQTSFTVREDADLSALVLPNGSNRVLVFERAPERTDPSLVTPGV